MSARYSDAEKAAAKRLPPKFASILDGPVPSVEWLLEFRRRIKGSRAMACRYKDDIGAVPRIEAHRDAAVAAQIVARAIGREQRRTARS